MKPNPVFRIFSFSPDPRDGNLWNAVVFLQKNYIYKAEHLLRTILERFTTETVIVPAHSGNGDRSGRCGPVHGRIPPPVSR